MSWDFDGQAQVDIENEQLTWTAASGQTNSYPVHTVTSASYECGGFLRLISTLHTQLIPVPETVDSEQLVSEITAYLASIPEQVNSSTSALGEAHTLVTDELAKLDQLKTLGFITEEEFHYMKHKLQLN